MTSTGPPFTGATVVETLRSRTSLSRQGPCLFDVGFPPSGPRFRIFTSGLLCMPVAPDKRFALSAFSLCPVYDGGLCPPNPPFHAAQVYCLVGN